MRSLGGAARWLQGEAVAWAGSSSLALASKGARIWITDIDLKAAQGTADERLRAGASEARALACDVRKAENFERLAGAARELRGGMDLLINNAGVASVGSFEEQTLESWQWIMDTNLWE